MNSKKGFTLVEILAVIALIGIVMLLVIPNVLLLFKKAKKSLFLDEVLNIYSNTYTTYIYRSSEGDYSKRFCVGKDSTLNKLNIEEKDNFYYDITVNSEGKIIDFQISNDLYSISINNINGIKKKDIKENIITDSKDINCNNNVAEIPNLNCIITNTNRECLLFNIKYNREQSI